MLKKELIELCLLHLMYIKDVYGYELIRRIYGVVPDIQESTVYALLRNLSKNGFAEQYVGEKSDGPTRKYYHITQAGREKRDHLISEWRELRDNMAALGVE